MRIYHPKAYIEHLKKLEEQKSNVDNERFNEDYKQVHRSLQVPQFTHMIQSDHGSSTKHSNKTPKSTTYSVS